MSGIALLCSGQGKQDATMFGRIQQYPEVQALMKRISKAGVLPDKILAWQANPDLIFHNTVAQPLICLYQMLVWEIIKGLLPDPDIFAGYSLGELSAYGCAGFFQPEEVVRLAAIRGKLMMDGATVPQTMAAVIGLKRDQLAKICAGSKAQLAIINGSDHFIVGLPLENLTAFITQCKEANATKIVHLPVSVAAHTTFMQSAAETFRAILQKTEFHPKPSGILAGISGEKLFTREQMIAALTAQIRQTIDWRACMESAIAYGCRVFLEIGPGNSLTRMVLESFPKTEARSVSEFHDIYAVKNWIATALSRQA